MKLEFDVKVTEKDLYSFNIEQAYKGKSGCHIIAVCCALGCGSSVKRTKRQYGVCGALYYSGYSGAAICAVFTQGQGKDDYEDK